MGVLPGPQYAAIPYAAQTSFRGFAHPASLFPMQYDQLPVDEIDGARIPGDGDHGPPPIAAENGPGQMDELIIRMGRLLRR